MVYLRRSISRRFGSEVAVHFVDLETREGQASVWAQGQPLPVVVIAGEVFLQGSLSFYKVIDRLYELRRS